MSASTRSHPTSTDLFPQLLRCTLSTGIVTPLIIMSLAAQTISPVESPLLPYRNPSLAVERRVDDLLIRMTLAEKVGQMTQVEFHSIDVDDISAMTIGSLLSGGDGYPGDNSPEAWKSAVDRLQSYALKSRLGIPLLFGIDAVHGHGHVHGATIFPHNIGLGATHDSALVRRIARATAEELVATGIRWDFGPVVAVPQDIRWGRTYEAFSENSGLVERLASAYVRGMQGVGLRDSLSVLATPKHFIGDGGTVWESSKQNVMHHAFLLDQGDMRSDESFIRRVFLPPYQSAISAGAQCIMVSYNSWNGTKMHAQKYWLTDVLKGEMGFDGFLISDWAGMNQVAASYDSAVTLSVNAGLDMSMVPDDYKHFIATASRAVSDGRIPMARIDDAARRILRVKFEMGLFDHPKTDADAFRFFGSSEHRSLAREAVRQSLVLLLNKGKTLPLKKDVASIDVSGKGGDDIGMMCGGWTVSWQGRTGNIMPGTSILEAVRRAVSPKTVVRFDRTGNFAQARGQDGSAKHASISLVVVGEEPYAEGLGDRADLSLSLEDRALIEKANQAGGKVVVLILSGRPLVVTRELGKIDALVAAWLPGTEGEGITDALFGDVQFSGKLPYAWPRSNNQLPTGFESPPRTGCESPLFPFGFGLTTDAESPSIPSCPG